MGQITLDANEVYRDAGAHEPLKSEIRGLFRTVDGAIDTVSDRMDTTDALNLPARMNTAETDIDALQALQSAGIIWTEQVVEVAATGNVVIASALENGDVLNGVTLVTGMFVALPFQSTPSQNGIYVVPASGAASRATWADAGSELVRLGFRVKSGTLYTNSRWVFAHSTAPSVGSDAIKIALIDDPTSATAQALALAKEGIRRQNIALKRTAPTIWAPGDSRTNSANADHTASNGTIMSKTGYSPLYWAWRLFPYWNCDTWWDDSWNSYTELAGCNQGRSSRSAIDLANDFYTNGAITTPNAQPWRVPIMAKSGDILWLPGMINDIWLANAAVVDILAAQRAVITEALSKGMKVILSVTQPISTAHANFADPSSNRTKLIALQAGQLAFATEFSGFPFFVHDTRAVLSATGDDKGTAAMFYDGVHHGDLGGYIEGQDLVDKVLRKIIPTVDYLAEFTFDNYLPNHLMTGTGGTVAASGASNTGTLPDGWRSQWVNGGSTMQSVNSVTADDEGYNQIEVAVTVSGSGTTGRIRINRPQAAIATELLGEWVIGVVDVRLSASAAWRNIKLEVQYRTAGNSYNMTDCTPYNDGISATTFPAELPNEIIDVRLMTAPYLVPLDRTDVVFNVEVIARGDSGNPGTIEVSKPRLQVIASPLQFWGF